MRTMTAARRVAKAVLRGLGLLRTARSLKARLRGTRANVPLVPVEAFTASCELAIRSLQANNHVFGDYLEFGVSRGTSMVCMARALSRADLDKVRLIGFDSFEGMPSEAATQGWEPGQFFSPVSTTKAYLKSEGVELGRVELVKGWFKDTLNHETAQALSLSKASLVMVDCDIYTASKEALWFVEPFIKDEAVIMFDDWGWRSDSNQIGQREAYTEFLERFPHFTSESLPAYRPEAKVFRINRRE